jgi:hypothetical protein
MKIRGTILTTLVLLAFSATASAVVIDFQSLEHIDHANTFYGTDYAEDGFSITGNLWTFGTLASRYTGSTAMYNNSRNGITTLTQTNGNPFSMQLIDLAELNSSLVADVAFTGALSGGGNVTQTFTIDGNAFGAETFLFSSLWANLTQVTWTQTSPFHQFDNITLNAPSAVPVPAAIWLFGTALIGFVGMSRIRKVA